MKQVPFYANHEDNMHCMLAAYRSVFDYFLHKQLSWEELEKLTGYTPGRAAWTVKALVKMLDMGFDIRMIEPFDYQRYLKEGEPYLETFFSPDELKWHYEHSNIRDIRPLIPAFLQRVEYECRVARLEDIDSMLHEDRLVFVTVNSRKLNDLEGFSSHAILVIDKEGEDYIVHDSGGKPTPPQPNRRVSRQKLWAAMGGADNTAEVTGFKLGASLKNKRLDVYVVEQLPALSRAFVAKLIEEGKVTVDGQIVSKPGHKLSSASAVRIDYDLSQLQEIPKIDLPVLYEDADCLVLDKPAGVLTHSAGAFSAEATVATFLRDRLQGMEGQRAGIVHRLDRATSGVIICAKNPAALSFLQKQFSQRKVKKIYNAIIEGQLEPEEAIIDMPIERNPKAPATFRVGANGKPATTHYKTLRTAGKYSLVELAPETGRTHQLRVHLARQGHPIVGDVLYAGATAERLYLHALSLEITLPNRSQQVFTAPLPAAFEALLEQAT